MSFSILSSILHCQSKHNFVSIEPQIYISQHNFVHPKHLPSPSHLFPLTRTCTTTLLFASLVLYFLDEVHLVWSWTLFLFFLHEDFLTYTQTGTLSINLEKKKCVGHLSVSMSSVIKAIGRDGSLLTGMMPYCAFYRSWVCHDHLLNKLGPSLS